MVDFGNTLVIDDDNYMDFVGPDVMVGGQRKAKGLIPRDYTANPQGSYKSTKPFDPNDLPLIPREEWSDRIAEQDAHKSSLEHMRNDVNIEVLDQNGQGYCWAYSTTMCVMMSRMAANMPKVRLSAHSVAWTIKNGRDQGGWGAQSADFIQERGVMDVETWPEKSMNGRTYNTLENWENAKQYRITESWMDLVPRQYDRDMTFDQTMTCLLSNIPVVGDFNWWGHSVCLNKALEFDKRLSLSDPNRWGTGTANSWGQRWGTDGWGALRGRKGIPDGGLGVRVATAA